MVPLAFRSIAIGLLAALAINPATLADPLPGTQPLEATGDLSAKMVEGIDRWLARETSRAAEERARTWQAAAKDHTQWETFANTRREELRQRLGMVDTREPGSFERFGSTADAGPFSTVHIR